MILKYNIQDKRFPLSTGAGSDAIHKDPIYSYAVTQLVDEAGRVGTGLAFTIGAGNELVCQAAAFYAEKLKGRDIEELMSNFGQVFNELSNEQQFRWLGPQKGVVHLALASITNACYDLWAKTRGVPLWKLLIDLSAKDLVNTLDLSYLEDELSKEEALHLLEENLMTRENRMGILETGYQGYDTSVGWFNYSDEQVRINCKKAIDNGFSAMKLKVGSKDALRDIRRANIVREVAGDDAKVMLDANQQWTFPQAVSICQELKEMNPYWVEEPTHPDDVLAHQKLAKMVSPIKIAMGEHVPNKVLFKNYLQLGAAGFIQVDAVRVGGVSEFLTVSLLARKFNIPVVPHVGDMGQLHQHLVLFNHVNLGHEALFLEHIPHLRSHFVHPVRLEDGVYKTPMEVGSSCDLI
ncbi:MULTISPECIES: enolase C-terminal domain-like protein [Sphingobacterium]|uniref:Racemase n=1 Tax=Sphingobacterium cellulitidis TaxID=1768011 RepID=A0A8H9KVR5_9SPHI|nr:MULTISPECIES: enolase C-terminal domain-like protein [Sphingobacterium]MBA8987633.1 L-fuconate dehydratase [Sphingobacterium soli]WFB64306.1 enolase C-terminal domain-like protein [Sphingobacterium sp. WM]GGE21882.1 racemase [Sphingobacterium soli]